MKVLANMSELLGDAARVSQKAMFTNLPGWLVLPGIRTRWSRSIDVNSLDELDIKLSELPTKARVDIMLSPDLFLKKNLLLPVAAKLNLKRMVDLQISQTAPAGGVKLAWIYDVKSRDKSKLRVEVHLIKKSFLKLLEDMIDKHGMRLRSVGVIGLGDEKLLLDNRVRQDRARRIWNAATLAVTCVLVLYLMATEFHKKSELEKQVVELKESQVDLAAKAVQLRQKLDSDNDEFAVTTNDVRIFTDEHQRLPIFLDLTELLPDAVWISEVSIVGTDIRLSGFSEIDVTDVMASIRNQDWASTVELGGPISFDNISQRNRFDLTVRLASTVWTEEK